jgi:threonylcarbamoyladenosine tRNA methylthiotransferase MtaB
VGTFYIENFGCRATQADGAALERQFVEQGLKRAPHADAAEVIVLNTCTVTAAADQDARAAIRRANRANPKAQIVVTGCYAQRAPKEIAALPGVTRVIGNSHKHELARIAVQTQYFVPVENLAVSYQPSALSENFPTNDDRRPTTEIFVSDIFAHTELLAAPVFDAANERTRPNLKVQDGCDNRCSFCVIPFVRGQSRSLPLEQVISEANALVDAGYRELVISGINLGRWGRDLDFVGRASSVVRNPGDSLESQVWSPKPSHRRTTDDRRLVDLIRVILDHTALEKLRISSVEPMDWSDELISLMASSPRIAKHAHVPMQSGSDAVLRRMHRKYRPWHYREKILEIRQAMPTAAIGADVMVGFPGETDREFEETRRMVEELPFTYLHVFTYSARPGTPAANMQHQVPVRVARERNRVLRELAAQKKLAFMRSFVGKRIDAITLNTTSACVPAGRHNSGGRGETVALTDNYLKLRLQGRHDPNQWVTTTVNCVEKGDLVGF